MALPTGIVTFLFTDLVGSTSRWEQARDAMASAIRRHDQLLTRAIEGNDGTVVKKMGDGFMAVFADPADAAAAAIAAQSSLHTEPWSEALGTIEARMGIHTGPVEIQDGDYFGPTVNRAARIEAAGHGGQILLTAAARQLIGDRIDGATFRALGEHHLRGLAHPEQVFQVEAEGLPTEFPPLRTESTPSNLPAGREVVGRDTEIAQVEAALAANRLVTIAGAGGAGKTTLAIATARRVAAQFPAGVWLVELVGLTDGSRIATEILGAIRRPATADRDPLGLLVQALEGQRMLLVLDNCEHIISDVARVGSAVLREAPDVTILATSREPLGVHGETVWQIPTLSLPAERSAASVAASDAGQLFDARARQAVHAFEITDDNAGLIFDLCRDLDGLPLAIELACARLRSMSLEDLRRRLSDRLAILRSGARDAIPHHRTLRDSVQWSYELLSPEEQRLYRQLSPFAGGFDLDAAEAVGADVVDEHLVLDVLDQLVTKSLIQHLDGRYRMLEVIRQFGHEMLEAEDETESAHAAHLAWLADLARTGGRQLEGAQQREWLHRFQAEIDNIRAGFSWALEHDPISGCGIAGALTRFFWMNAMEADTHRMTDARSFLAEGYDWAVALMEAAGDALPPKQRARLQSGIGGMLCVRSGRFEEATERLAEAERIFEELGDDRNLGWAMFYDAIAGWGRRPESETLELLEGCLASHVKGQDKGGQLFATALLGNALGVVGRLAEARPYIDQFAKAADAIQIPNLSAHASDALILHDGLEKQVDTATITNAVKALEGFQAINNYACMTHTLGNIAIVLARLGHPEEAGVVVGLSHAIRDRLNMVLAPYEDRTDLAAEAVREAAADGSAGWDADLERGRTMEPDEGLAWTIQVLQGLDL